MSPLCCVYLINLKSKGKRIAGPKQSDRQQCHACCEGYTMYWNGYKLQFLEGILREGARKLIQEAIEKEINELLEMY